jgi:hypothetical protein
MTQSNLTRFALCAVALLVGGTPAFGQANFGLGNRQAVPIAPAAGAPVQGFSVVLVLGSLKDSAEKFAPELPRGAQRALSDISDFLPYRSYRLLDSAWILNPGSGRVTSRLRGTDNRDYDVSLDSSTTATSNVIVKFTLRDGDGGRAPSASHTIATRAPFVAQADLQTETARLEAALAELESRLATLRTVYASNHPSVQSLRSQINGAQGQIAAAKARHHTNTETIHAGASVIDTGFTMSVGETVVVGTSRLQGDTALIVLLTAVPRGSK